jgi:2-alkyl-3-oxoalkanoate reductase
MMKIAVIGATGVLGRQVLPRLVERGHRVRAIARQATEVEKLQRMGIEAVLGDILEPGTLLPATAGCEAALHLATAIPRPGQPQNWSLNDRIRREGTRNFVGACQANGVRRYIQQSITLLYGEHGQEIVDEDAAVQSNPITQSAVEMETIVQAGSFEWSILRGGLFYGPYTEREDEWRGALRAGELQLPGDGRDLISLVHVVDMARAVVTAVESALPGSMYNVVDDEPVSYSRLFTYMAAQLDTAVPPADGPRFLPSLGCSNARARQELSWQPVYNSYRSGLA